MNDAFINIASQITPDSQRVADLDFDGVALYEFVKSKSGNQSFEIPLITEAQMLDLIKKIPSSKAIGCAGLSAKVLKLAASVLVHPLCRLMNLSISTGCFPSTWKTAQVTPLFKRAPVKTQATIDQFLYYLFSWPEIAENATAHAREYMAIWPPYALRKRMAEVKENENRTTSGLPGTSAVIRSSS